MHTSHPVQSEGLQRFPRAHQDRESPDLPLGAVNDEAVAGNGATTILPYERDFARSRRSTVSQPRLRGPQGPSTAAARSIVEGRASHVLRACRRSKVSRRPCQARLEASAMRAGANARRHATPRTGFSNTRESSISGRSRHRKHHWLRDGDKCSIHSAGSGTTLLECAHAGLERPRIERNPLPLDRECEATPFGSGGGPLRALAARVTKGLRDKADRLVRPEPRQRTCITQIWGRGGRRNLPSLDYLRSWFPSRSRTGRGDQARSPARSSCAGRSCTSSRSSERPFARGIAARARRIFAYVGASRSQPTISLVMWFLDALGEQRRTYIARARASASHASRNAACRASGRCGRATGDR
jgi:hypothetical protein